MFGSWSSSNFCNFDSYIWLMRSYNCVVPFQGKRPVLLSGWVASATGVVPFFVSPLSPGTDCECVKQSWCAREKKKIANLFVRSSWHWIIFVTKASRFHDFGSHADTGGTEKVPLYSLLWHRRQRLCEDVSLHVLRFFFPFAFSRSKINRDANFGIFFSLSYVSENELSNEVT
jgi:hypothetical protein